MAGFPLQFIFMFLSHRVLIFQSLLSGCCPALGLCCKIAGKLHSSRLCLWCKQEKIVTGACVSKAVAFFLAVKSDYLLLGSTMYLCKPWASLFLSHKDIQYFLYIVFSKCLLQLALSVFCCGMAADRVSCEPGLPWLESDLCQNV